jgi:membrane protease YdiL (CAAX protease family)
MKQLYSARNGLEAHDLRLFLESQGVHAKVFGDNNALEIGFAFTPASAPSVFVEEVDFERAAELMEQFFDRPQEPASKETWTCAACGQVIEAQFDACWKCETPRASNYAVETPASFGAKAGADVATTETERRAANVDAPPSRLPEVTAPNHEIWIELAAVITICWFPYFAQGIFDLLIPPESTEPSYITDAIWSTIWEIPEITVILYVVYRSGGQWKDFGIRRPRWLMDVALAMLIFFMDRLVFGVGYQILYDLGALSTSTAPDAAAGSQAAPLGFVEKFADVGNYLVAALNEELVYRCYLITRFEKLLKSLPKSILWSSLLFGSVHLYQGWDGVFLTFLTGVVFGIAYCMTRRLWPLVISHTLINIIASWV